MSSASGRYIQRYVSKNMCEKFVITKEKVRVVKVIVCEGRHVVCGSKRNQSRVAIRCIRATGRRWLAQRRPALGITFHARVPGFKLVGASGGRGFSSRYSPGFREVVHYSAGSTVQASLSLCRSTERTAVGNRSTVQA